MQKMNLKISNMQWRKTNEVQRKFGKAKKKYEINTTLPLARARRLKSDVHDSSLIMIEHPSWEEQ